MGRMKDLTGQKFGRLTAIRPTEKRKRGSVVWQCKCICGNEEVYASRANLEQGHTKSCGCLQAQNISKRNKVRQTKDITNKKFGKLTAIKPTTKRDNGYIVWECKCDCGKKTYVNLRNLVSGNTLSCGCLNSSIARVNAVKNISKYKKENYIADTRLDVVNNNKLRKNNTTGYRGVYLRKKDGKYTATIEFQKKRYFLGSYFTKEEAWEVRREAEDRLYGDFLEWYYKEYKNKSK